jgi:hypothetical protein
METNTTNQASEFGKRLAKAVGSTARKPESHPQCVCHQLPPALCPGKGKPMPQCLCHKRRLDKCPSAEPVTKAPVLTPLTPPKPVTDEQLRAAMTDADYHAAIVLKRMFGSVRWNPTGERFGHFVVAGTFEPKRVIQRLTDAGITARVIRQPITDGGRFFLRVIDGPPLDDAARAKLLSVNPAGTGPVRKKASVPTGPPPVAKPGQIVVGRLALKRTTVVEDLAKFDRGEELPRTKQSWYQNHSEEARAALAQPE